MMYVIMALNCRNYVLSNKTSKMFSIGQSPDLHSGVQTTEKLRESYIKTAELVQVATARAIES